MTTASDPAVTLLDPVKQYRRLQGDIDARVRNALSHGRFINGPEVAELERQLAEFVGVKHVVGVANGTDALQVALRAERIGPGDAVFVPAFSFVASAGAVALTGATPVFVDIDPDTFVIDPKQLKETIRRVRSAGELRPKAVMPVDLFGLPAEYELLEPLCRAEKLFLIVDGAQSFGSSQHGRRVGSMGDATITSFFPSKPLGAWGDGGAMFTDDSGREAIWRSVSAHGAEANPYDAERVGTNSRLDTLQAAVLLAKLQHFPEEIARRNAIARLYTDAMGAWARTPHVPDGTVCVWAQYSLLLDDRERVREELADRGIPTRVYYPLTLPQQAAFRRYAHVGLPCPVAEATAARIVSLPMHSELDDSQVERVIGAVRDVLKPACRQSAVTEALDPQPDA